MHTRTTPYTTHRTHARVHMHVRPRTHVYLSQTYPSRYTGHTQEWIHQGLQLQPYLVFGVCVYITHWPYTATSVTLTLL